MTQKRKLDDLISTNYSYFQVVSSRIIHKKRMYGNKDELLHQSITDVYDMFLKNDSKFSIILEDPDQFIKWFCTFMSNSTKWKNSKFNKTIRMKEMCLDNEEYLQDLELPDNTQTLIELSAESINQATKDFIVDFINSGLSQQQAEKYFNIFIFKKTLPMHEQILFDLYYMNSLSTRKIADMVSERMDFKINYQSINIMINHIKNKIKEYKWNY